MVKLATFELGKLLTWFRIQLRERLRGQICNDRREIAKDLSSCLQLIDPSLSWGKGSFKHGDVNVLYASHSLKSLTGTGTTNWKSINQPGQH